MQGCELEVPGWWGVVIDHPRRDHVIGSDRIILHYIPLIINKDNWRNINDWWGPLDENVIILCSNHIGTIRVMFNDWLRIYKYFNMAVQSGINIYNIAVLTNDNNVHIYLFTNYTYSSTCSCLYVHNLCMINNWNNSIVILFAQYFNSYMYCYN